MDVLTFFIEDAVRITARTADLGDKLIVGLNSDSSIQRIKGNSRPIIDRIQSSL